MFFPVIVMENMTKNIVPKFLIINKVLLVLVGDLKSPEVSVVLQ